MAIPLATTAITVFGTRPHTDVDPDADGYDTPAASPSIVVADVRAIISGPTRLNVEGAEIEGWKLRADPCDLTQWDHVTDQTTGIYYKVQSCSASLVTMFNLDHVMADLVVTSGLPSEGGSDVDS